MKKKVVLAVAFVLFILGTVILSCDSADAKTFKRKPRDWDSSFPMVKANYGDDLQLKVGKKKGWAFYTADPDVFSIDDKGHVTFNTIGVGEIFAKSPNGKEYRGVVKVFPPIFEAEDITVKVGETFSPKINLGDIPMPEKLYYNMSTYWLEEDIKINYENGKPLRTITALKPGDATVSIQWQDCSTSFTVTVVE